MEEKTTLKLGVIGVVLFVLFFVGIAVFPIVVIGAGQRGVVFNNFSGVENRVLGEGTHTRIPFVESVIDMPIQEQANSFTESAGSSDSQTINVALTVNWHLDPSRVNKIYQNIGNTDAVVSKILTPNVQDAIKAAMSKYVALDVQKNRDNVSAHALELLQAKVKGYDVLVDNVSLTNINFGTEFNAAVEQAQVAQQEAKKAEYQVATAKAHADAAIAEAQGESQANALKQQSLTPQILEQMAINKWRGILPQYLGAGAPIPFLNLPN